MKKVRCVNCGYMSTLKKGVEAIEARTEGLPGREHSYYTPIELDDSDRKNPEGVLYGICCFRHVIDFDKERKSSGENIKTIIAKDRNCGFFVGYCPGCSPERHLDVYDMSKNKLEEHLWQILYLIIGAWIALASTIVFGR
jgi:hypothetical protein